MVWELVGVVRRGRLISAEMWKLKSKERRNGRKSERNVRVFFAAIAPIIVRSKHDKYLLYNTIQS